MTPIRLSHIWYRRLYAALFVVSLGYVILYALQAFNLQYIPLSVRIELLPAIGAALVLIASIALFTLGKKVTSFWPSYIVFVVFLITTAYIVQSTNGVHSDFLVVWALAVFVAPIFGAYGWLPVVVMTGSYVAGEYITGGLPTETLVLLALSSVLPLAAVVILWRDTPESEQLDDRNVKKLASQLSEGDS